MYALEFDRYLTAGGLERTLVYTAPAQMSVKVVNKERHLVLSGDADRHGTTRP
jgi:hypothetical protein